MSAQDWRRVIGRHAQAAGVELAPETVDELAAHLDDIYLNALEQGRTESAARQQAQAALEASGLRPLRHDPRPDARRVHRGIAQDVASASSGGSFAMIHAFRMALRQFRLHQGFASITILVLGLGTGAATVVYTIVDAVVLRPLPYEAPDRLVKFWDTNVEKGLGHDPISPVTFLDYRALPAFEDAAAWWRPDVNLVDPGLEPVRVRTVETSSNLFHLLGVAPHIGPGFDRDDQLHNRSEHQIVISDRLWRSRYNADEAIIGRQLSLGAEPWTVVGVMPSGFHFPDDIDVWQRLRWDLSQHSRHAHFMEAVARLADGVPLGRAQADARSLAARLAAEFEASNRGWAFSIVPLLDDQLGYYRPALYVLLGAVGILLVIACLNVASLLLTRALSREREMAVRTALGAGPRQILVQLVAESLLLSLAGATIGLLVALVALPLILAATPVEVPRLAEASVDPRALLLTVALVAGTTVVFGLVPAQVLLKRQIGTDLRSGDRGSSLGARRMYQGLVVAEVALAYALLVSSALLVRTVSQMVQVPLGITAHDTVVASVQLTAADSGEDAWQTIGTLHAQVLDRLREQPGVRSAGAANFLPMEHGWRGPLVRIDQPAAPDDAPQAQHHSVTPGYLETMGGRLLQGRLFTKHDDLNAEPVVMLNETAARRYFGSELAVGREMHSWLWQVGPLGRNLTWRAAGDQGYIQPTVRVIGVVADIQNVALGLPPEPAVFFPMRQFPFGANTIVINAIDSATAVAALRQALRQISPNTPLGSVQTWQERFAARTAEPRLLMTTLGLFGALAGLLAALGVYGLFSWSVAIRRRELAIRLTLGAPPAAVGTSVLSQSALLVIVGIIGGVAIMRAVQQFLASILFGVQPNDLTSTVTAAALLVAAALLASLPPAWRAMRVSPVEGLATM